MATGEDVSVVRDSALRKLRRQLGPLPRRPHWKATPINPTLQFHAETVPPTQKQEKEKQQRQRLTGRGWRLPHGCQCIRQAVALSVAPTVLETSTGNHAIAAPMRGLQGLLQPSRNGGPIVQHARQFPARLAGYSVQEHPGPRRSGGQDILRMARHLAATTRASHLITFIGARYRPI